ncbi:hypothetical protein [Acinetobacter calcoaceticus]|uniref:hypothetical protein n=2 Tax=Acinetobacter calcoaceticus TaxID=471 RepID=UPI00125042EC|nr:hypothetical protein [Acinetobacter calcoaceticus]
MKRKSEILQDIDNKIEEMPSLIDFIDKVDSITFPNVNSFNKIKWIEKDRPVFTSLISNIKDKKQFFSDKSLERALEILDRIKTRLEVVKRLINTELLNSDEQAQLRFFSDDNYELMMEYYIGNITFSYDTNMVLGGEDFNIITTEIKSKYRFFDLDSNYNELYEKLPEKEKEYVSRKIIELRNITNHASTYKIDEVNSYIKELDYLLNKKEVLSSAKNIIDTNTIANNLKENITVILNSDFANEYKNLADNLDKEAASINYLIIFLFVIIILIVLFKLIFVSLYNITSFTLVSAAWLAFIFSITALLGYLIKERKRLNNLREYYRTIQIELTALPKYIGEFSSDQRVAMLVNLSTNYFKGTSIHNRLNENNEENSLKNNSVIIEKILDLPKNLMEIKK